MFPVPYNTIDDIQNQTEQDFIDARNDFQEIVSASATIMKELGSPPLDLHPAHVGLEHKLYPTDR